MKILDLTPGKRGIWFNKGYRDAVFCEVGVVLEAADFDLVVFDPAHVNVGGGSNMARDYGHHTAAEVREFVVRMGAVAHRVSRTDALMAFKWNDHDQKLERVLKLLDEWWEPLFGQVTSVRKKHVCQTCWVMLRRREPARRLWGY
jgi:hypothetical protein